MIKLEHLTKIYTTGNVNQTAVDDISLNLPDKGFVAIFGASGCGKTTLLNILGGLDKQTSGSLIVNGRDTQTFKKKDWDSYRNQEVGFVFQNYYLLPHLTVYENVALTLQMSKQQEDVKERVNKALEAVGILNLSKKYPKHLSGGEAQRVAIARALVGNPTIILADEPTGALDKENAKQVMEILKRISLNHLVVAVTHNEKLIENYADRLLEISYGKIVSDSSPLGEISKEKEYEYKKVSIPLIQKAKWSVRNIYKKKSRSIPIMIASSIALAAVGIVISMTTGVTRYTKKAQEDSLGDYPIYISCYSSTSPEGHEEELIEYPSIEEVIIERQEVTSLKHVTAFPDEFLTYMDNMPSNLYSFKEYNSAVYFPILSKLNDTYSLVSSTYNFTPIAPNMEKYAFIEEQYDVLKGRLPTKADEVVLVVDTFNRVDVDDLERLGFDVSGERISFNDIFAKEYHTVSMSDYYEERLNLSTNNTYYRRKTSSSYEDLYENHSDVTLKIVGILREKPNSSSDIYSPGILYSPLLTEHVKSDSANSLVVKKQLEYGMEVDVLTGAAFNEYTSGSYTYTAEYQYEANLYNFGYKERAIAMYLYTKTFETRFAILDYFKQYNNPKETEIVLRARDYLEQITSSFSSLVNTFSSIVFVFASISILIAGILTAILMYISVLERNKEIGLLRSLGAREVDVSTMFVSEAIIMGFISAIVACLLIVALLPVSGKIVLNLVKEFGSSAINPSLKDLTGFNWWIIPLTFGASIVLSILSSLIPAFIAGKRKPVDSLRE